MKRFWNGLTIILFVELILNASKNLSTYSEFSLTYLNKKKPCPKS